MLCGQKVVLYPSERWIYLQSPNSLKDICLGLNFIFKSQWAIRSGIFVPRLAKCVLVPSEHTSPVVVLVSNTSVSLLSHSLKCQMVLPVIVWELPQTLFLRLVFRDFFGLFVVCLLTVVGVQVLSKLFCLHCRKDGELSVGFQPIVYMFVHTWSVSMKPKPRERK